MERSEIREKKSSIRATSSTRPFGFAAPLPKAQPPKSANLGPDGWEGFERAIDAAVKAGPKHKKSAKKPDARYRS
jgi:hypothetical protein